MGHNHEPSDNLHDQAHGHQHTHDLGTPLAPALDLAVEDADLSPTELGRRRFLASVGMLGAGAAAASVLGPVGTAVAGERGPVVARTIPKEGSAGWPATTTSTRSTRPTRCTGWWTRHATPARTAWTGW